MGDNATNTGKSLAMLDLCGNYEELLVSVSPP